MTDKKDQQNLDALLRESYTEDSFGGQEGLLAVREDASRHIQRIDKEGIYNMVIEILDNSIDESLEVLNRAGQVRDNLDPVYISLYLNQKTGVCQIADQGRGITMNMSKTYPNLTVLNALFEKDNTGSKGTKAGITNKGYSSKTMGVHGAGAFVVTACSEYLKVTNRVYNMEKDQVDVYQIGYQKGIPIQGKEMLHGRVAYLGSNKDKIGNNRSSTGLTVEFKPDLDIMTLYNPNTNKVDEDFYFVDRIKKRIKDTLSVTEEPLVINLQVEGEEVEVFDTRQLSLTHDKVKGEDYIKVELKPQDNPKLMERMEGKRITDFSLELLIMKNPDLDARNRFEGYVNRIKVSSSPHVTALRRLVSRNMRFYTSRDKDLQGYFKDGILRGLTVVPILYVEKAQWGGQVKMDYTDYQVSNYMSEMIELSNEMTMDGAFHPLLQHCFEVSKPYLMAEKNKDEELRLIREREKDQELQQKTITKSIQEISESLRWLNKRGEFNFNSDINQSDLVIFEGKSAGGKLDKLMNKFPNLASFSGLMGKIENIKYSKTEKYNISLPEMEARGIPIAPLTKLRTLFQAPFRSIILMGDNDADGSHIKSLLRYFIWVEYPEIINQGRLFEVSPDFCTYQCKNPELTYEFMGETKRVGTAGNLRTQQEYDVLRRTHPNDITFTLFKGVGSVTDSIIESTFKDDKNWVQVPPLTNEEEYQMDEMFTNSSEFKKSFTEAAYLTEMAIRKECVKRSVYKDCIINPEELLDSRTTSDFPIFSGSLNNTLEEYEEGGSEQEFINDIVEKFMNMDKMY